MPDDTVPCHCHKCGDIHQASKEERKARAAKRREITRCVECREFVPYTYMLQDKIWALAKLTKGQLHLECFERRTGHELKIEDFNQNVPCNEIVLWAWAKGAHKQ